MATLGSSDVRNGVADLAKAVSWADSKKGEEEEVAVRLRRDQLVQRLLKIDREICLSFHQGHIGQVKMSDVVFKTLHTLLCLEVIRHVCQSIWMVCSDCCWLLYGCMCCASDRILRAGGRSSEDFSEVAAAKRGEDATRKCGRALHWSTPPAAVATQSMV